MPRLLRCSRRLHSVLSICWSAIVQCSIYQPFSSLLPLEISLSIFALRRAFLANSLPFLKNNPQTFAPGGLFFAPNLPA